MTPPQSDLPADDVRVFLAQPEAWAQVSRGLQRIALAILGDEGDAEDVVQGAWLEVLKDPRRGQSQGWLRRLVRFRALDFLRRKAADPAPLEEGSNDVTERESEPADMRGKLDAQREVLEAVRALDEPYLSTVVLRYFEGQGPKAIAAQLGVPERTIKTRLTRAHHTLRSRLGARYQDSSGKWAPALVLFSGYDGLTASQPLAPLLGSAIMKKASWVAAAIAVAIVLPLAMQSMPGANDGMTLPLPRSVGLELPNSVPDMRLPSAPVREAIPVAAPGPAREQATFEYAFPPRLDSSVGSLGILMRWADGSPADHQKIGIMPKDAADAFLMRRTVYTDSTGFVRVDQLTPGQVNVNYDRLGHDEVQITAGEYTQVEKEAPLGTRLSGQVLGPNGLPVSGALVFVADSRGGSSLPEATAIADGTGRYAIQNVFDRSYVSARAPGFSPSLPINTGISTGQPAELDLTLRGNPGALRGLVLSPDGLPVVGAKIRIIPPVAFEGLGPGSRRGGPLAFDLRTDSSGRFESDQVGSGSLLVKARTATWQPWVETVEVESGESRSITIRFERGLQLTGSVLREDGGPIPKALVLVGKTAAHESFRVQTDEAGGFRIDGLPPGPSDLKVYLKGFEELETQVTLHSDRVNRADFTLHALSSAGGVVVDESGAPLAHWLVAIESRKGLWTTSAWTGADGAFELLGIPAGTTDLIVTSEDYWASATRMVVEAALPTQGPLRIVVPASVNPRSSIRMQLLVDGRPASPATQVRLRSASPLAHRDVHPNADGLVHLEKLASQVFRLEVTLEGHAPLHRSFQLGVKEDLDLGTLHIEKGGRIHVRVEGPAADSVASCNALDGRGMPLQSFDVYNGEGISPPLPTGTVQLRYSTPDGATQFAEVKVVAGETTVARFMTRSGTDRVLKFVRRSGQPLRFRTIASVTDALGNVHFYSEDLQRQALRRSGSAEGATVIELRGLQLGSYRIRLLDPTGPVHESWLQVRTLDGLEEDGAPIQLDW